MDRTTRKINQLSIDGNIYEAQVVFDYSPPEMARGVTGEPQSYNSLYPGYGEQLEIDKVFIEVGDGIWARLENVNMKVLRSIEAQVLQVLYDEGE